MDTALIVNGFHAARPHRSYGTAGQVRRRHVAADVRRFDQRNHPALVDDSLAAAKSKSALLQRIEGIPRTSNRLFC
jgi:hypothetical protein